MSEQELRSHRCCFTGHRPEKLKRAETVIKKGLEEAILKAIHDGYTTFITGMARGVDIWAGQRSYEGTIDLVKEDGVLYGKTSGTGLPLEDEKENLSAIIQKLNERLGTNFTEMDKVLEQFVRDMAGNEEMVLRAKNPLDLFKIIYDNNIMDVVLSRMDENTKFCERYLEDEEFRKEVDKILLPLVHARLSKI